MSGEPNGQTVVEITITQQQSGDVGQTVTRITRTGGEGMSRDEILDAFESALRGAGYQCPMESLNVVGE